MIPNNKGKLGFDRKETVTNIINIKVLSHTIQSFKLAFSFPFFTEIGPDPDCRFVRHSDLGECRRECFQGYVAALVWYVRRCFPHRTQTVCPSSCRPTPRRCFTTLLLLLDKAHLRDIAEEVHIEKGG